MVQLCVDLTRDPVHSRPRPFETKTMGSLAGYFLVASRHLKDPNFERTVVLLVHHTKDGTLGVVLNRRAETSIRELWEDVSNSTCETDQHFHLGGPVSGPLMALHTDRSLAEQEVLPGLYFAAHRDNIAKLVNQSKHPFRLFVGHSGWGGGQLEDELSEGSWFTAPATLEQVFEEESDVWRQVTQQIGREMLTSSLGLKNVPPDPTVN